ncbi:TPA: hypothetical protein I7114_04670 [Vibrio vulnificus]|nr:hypothetical protein [Vibrio vulnificus]
MLNPITSIKKGLSFDVLNLPTYLIQSGFIRDNINQTETIYTATTGETVRLNTVHCELRVGAPLFSYLLTHHQNLSLNKWNESKDTITVKYGKHSDLLKCLKARENHRIGAIEKLLERFVTYLKPEQQITLKGETFSIFDTLEVDYEERTITYRFSEQFINSLSERKYPFTYIQIEDLKEVGSNKLAGHIFLYSKSIAKMDEKYLRKDKLSAMFAIVKNTNQYIDSALETLKNKGIVLIEKFVGTEEVDGLYKRFSQYVFKKIKKSTVRKAKAPTTVKKDSVSKPVETQGTIKVSEELLGENYYLQCYSRLKNNKKKNKTIFA